MAITFRLDPDSPDRVWHALDNRFPRYSVNFTNYTVNTHSTDSKQYALFILECSEWILSEHKQ